jgi:hypothetical protein
MFRHATWIALTFSLLGVVPGTAGAQTADSTTVLTFSQPVEVPGHVLPAGTYTFRLFDSMSDRHIVRVFNADGTDLIATLMAIPDYRLTATDQTVIKFTEVPRGSPEAIRAWFYPGNATGHEFVYSKTRAAQLARAANAPVPAMADDADDVEVLRTAPIVAILPDESEVPVATAVRMTPMEHDPEVGMMGRRASETPGNAARTGEEPARDRLPQTASLLPLFLLFGLGTTGLGLGLVLFGRRTAPTRL